MKKFLLLSICFFIALDFIASTVNINNIEIIRDKFGVPHIFGKTDEETAYGLAWATCEDDFSSVQENLLTARGRLAEVKGKDGAILDFIANFVGARESVDKLYSNSFSPKFKNILSAYVAAVNKYAAENPKEVWLKDIFPITEKDVLVGYSIGMALMTNVPFSVMKISDGNMWKFEQLKQVKGSNAFAVNNNKTKDGNTYLSINSHQPLEGPYSWYEVQLHSEEGWNILGGTFPGGVTIFHGATPNLAWAHTVSFADLDDVYKLKMHPSQKLTYYYDGKWLKLKERVCKMKVKIFWFIKIPVKKKYYESIYGPTLEKDGVFYSIRFPSKFDIRSAEQWYRMNKSTNLAEFKEALKMQAFTGLNIIYADKENNIYYVDNAQFPRRNKNYDWWHVLPGDTSAAFWNANDYYPFDSLFQLQNPVCGWIHSNNQTPFFSTLEDENIDRKTHPMNDYYFAFNNNRSLRTNYLFASSGKISYDEFKQIKFDNKFMSPAYTYSMSNIEDIFQKLDINKYPQIKEAMIVIKKWDRGSDYTNKQASIMALTIDFLKEKLIKNGMFPAVQNVISEAALVDCVDKAQKHLMKHFGKLEVPLGDVQKLVRGDKALPVSGMPDVITAMDLTKYKNGMYKAISGESYIELIQFTKEGVKIESIQPYGQSNKKGSKHYDDQMEMFVKHKLKPMSMDYNELLANNESVYHPK